MQIKRLAALSLAAVLTAAMLTGCDLLAWLAWLEENSDSSSVTSSPSSSSTSRPSYDDEDDDDDASSPPPAEPEKPKPDPNDPTTWTITNDGTLIVPSGATSNQITKDLLATHPGITSLDLRNSGLTSIGNWAFGSCTGLASVTLPSGLQSIGQYAFCDCKSLTSVTLPGSLTSIEKNAFSGCDGLTSVTLPEGLTNLGAGAFLGCTGLTSVTLPDKLTSIGAFAFQSCKSLISIHIGAGIIAPNATIGESAFKYVPNTVTVYYPSEWDDLSKKEKDENLNALNNKLQTAGLPRNVQYEPDSKMLQAAPAAPAGVKELLDAAGLFRM